MKIKFDKVLQVVREGEEAQVDTNYLGYFATSSDLVMAHAVGVEGQYAMVGDTDTFWTWDSLSNTWKNTVEIKPTNFQIYSYYNEDYVNIFPSTDLRIISCDDALGTPTSRSLTLMESFVDLVWSVIIINNSTINVDVYNYLSGLEASIPQGKTCYITVTNNAPIVAII